MASPGARAVQLPGRVVAWRCRGGLDWRHALAVGEHLLDLALGQGVAHAAACRVDGSALVLGLYSSAPAGAGEEEGVERRVTGGDPAEMPAGECYTAIAFPASRLAEAVAVGEAAAERLSPRAWGATVAEKAALVELLGGSCSLDEALPGARLVRGGTLWRGAVSRYLELFSSPAWRLYRYRRGAAEAEVERGGYYARLSIELTDGYITGWWLDSNMMAAPPMEIFSVLATAKGAPFHELTLSNLEVALEKRLETHGVTVRDLQLLLRRLHSAVGERLYLR